MKYLKYLRVPFDYLMLKTSDIKINGEFLTGKQCWDWAISLAKKHE